MGKFIVFFLTTTCLQATLADTKEFPLSGISKVEVNNTSGNTTVIGVDKGKAIVVAEKKKFGKHCKLKIEKREQTLFVAVEADVIYKDECRVELNVTGPKAATFDIKTGSGDLAVKQVTGDLGFSIGSGAATIDSEVSSIDGKSGSGDMILKGLVANASLKAGSGKINVTYTSPPSEGELDIQAGSGKTEIVFPLTAKIRTTFMSGTGKMTNDLGETPESPFKISMKTGSGDVHIKKQ
jgi:DUF4097 and DUF4098 domain-containing protein YvlB